MGLRIQGLRESSSSVHTSGRNVLRIGFQGNVSPGANVVDWAPNIDSEGAAGVDQFPFPFPDNQFDEVVACHFIERSHDPMTLMAELHRVTRPGGLVRLTALHWTNPEFASDLRNRNHISSYSLRNFTLDRVVYDFYTDVRFAQRAARVTMPLLWRILGFQFCVNLDPRFPSLRFFRQIWEHYLNFLVRANEIQFELEVLKD